MPQMTIELYDRRKRSLDLHYSGLPDSRMIQEITDAYGPNEKAVRQDWYRRKGWEPLIWRMEQNVEDLERLFYKLRLGQERALALMRTADNDNAKVGAIGKLANLISTEVELRQSLGSLPKVAEKLDVKQEIEQRLVTLNVTENEDIILNKAARILDRKLSQKKQPTKIH